MKLFSTLFCFFEDKCEESIGFCHIGTFLPISNPIRKKIFMEAY